MKAVINGKTYNTETATLLGEMSVNPVGDFAHVSEALYRTAKGAYFLAGEGGARTKYAENVGGAVYGGSKIMPLTEAEALAWGERHMDADAVAEHFAHMVEEA